jgi:hypothetical protein
MGASTRGGLREKNRMAGREQGESYSGARVESNNVEEEEGRGRQNLRGYIQAIR